jgi:hypothetical protein
MFFLDLLFLLKFAFVNHFNLFNPSLKDNIFLLTYNYYCFIYSLLTKLNDR